MNKEAFIKMALKLKGIHGTHGAFKKLIPWYKGHNAPVEVNARAVYAATNRRSLVRGVENYAHGTTAKRGGKPTVLKMSMDTKKGWRPYSFNRKATTKFVREQGGDIEDMRDHYLDLTRIGDDKVKAIKAAAGAKKKKLKQELGAIYRQLNNDVGAWAGPETKVIKARIVKPKT